MLKVTIKQLNEMVKNMKLDEDTPILFQYRENFPSDSGKDYTYKATHFCVSENALKEKAVMLLGIFKPEVTQC